MEYSWKIWQLNDEEKRICQELSQSLHISVPSAELLVRRGIQTPDEARNYIRPSLKDLHDPFLMKDMDKAVERLNTAIERKEKILVYGDYDVDGTTAVTLMYSFLKNLTDRLDIYIPDRHKEGYGISFQGIDYAQQQGCSLIVALDCGINEVAKVDFANERHIDCIICDHHTPDKETPKAVAVLNMKRAGCPYPYKELSGCGVGFKLVQALARYRGIPEEKWYNLLPLLALSIACDIVPVTGENRILTYFGLKMLNSHPTAGIKSLIKVAGLEGKDINISDLGFKIGPRINACGRLHTGFEAVKLLLTDNIEESEQRAKEIDEYNTDRRQYEDTTVTCALQMLAADPDNNTKSTTVVYSPDWHKGVVGIAASKLTDTYFRPTIVLTGDEGGIISGSARSVSTFDLYSALYACKHLLTNFGGHQFAAGLSLRKEMLPQFKQEFEHYVSTHITPEQLTPCLDIEQEIHLGDIDDQFYSIIKHLEPFGPGNPRPIFCTRHLINNRYTKRVGKNGEHLKVDLTDQVVAMEGIAFGQGDLALHIQNGNPVDVCYTINENTYNGRTTRQMMVEDIKKI